MDTILRVLVESSVRATAIAFAVASVLWAMRVKSPAIRHRAWTGVLVAMLLLPALSLWAPRIAVPILPAEPVLQPHEPASLSPEWKTSSKPHEITPVEMAAAPGTAPSADSLRLAAGNRPSQSRLSAYEIAATLYLVAFCALMARLLVGMVLAFRLVLNATRNDRVFLSSQCTIPLTVGLLRPRILLPMQSRNWAPEQVDAVLAHEREHVSRRDPLVEWLAMLNRCLYWFHPLTWWLRRKLAALAEQACDEAVLSRGHNPGKYAELLLELARSVKHGGALVAIWSSSIDGSTLAVRIRRILTADRSPALSRTRLAFVTALCGAAIVVPATCKLVRAQPILPGQPTTSVLTAEMTQVDAATVQTTTSHSDPSKPTDEVASRNWQQAGQNPYESQGPHSVIQAQGNVPPKSGGMEPQVSPKQNKESDLKDFYKRWLDEDVVYIIAPEERNAFLALATDEEREKFIEQFWSRRNPDPREPGNSFKVEHYRRLAYANGHFASGIPGWKTDRGRIYILYGEPDGKESYPSGGSFQREYWQGGGTTSVYPFERWRYRHIDGIGDDVVIEFVDKTLDGNFVLDQNPIQGGATQATVAKGPALLPHESQLPYAVRTDFIRISADKVLVPITIGLENKNLQFQKKLQSNRAQVGVHAEVYDQTDRIAAEFEDTISAEYADDSLAQGKTGQSIYQKMLVLKPGERYRLDLVLTDLNNGNRSATRYGILTPKFGNDSLQASSMILASRISGIPPQYETESFVIDDMKVQPNVWSEYTNGQSLIPYLQIYNATIDPATLKPSLGISFAIKSGNMVLQAVEENTGKAVQSVSSERVVIVYSLPVQNLDPGIYTLEIKVVDRISSRTLVTSTEFRVLNPPPGR
jgi:GWxTD domain-containing protein